MTASVIYHYEGPDAWWIESPEIPGYAAFGESRDEVTALAREGIPFASDDPEISIVGLDAGEVRTIGVKARMMRIAISAPTATYRRAAGAEAGWTGLPVTA